MKKPIVCIDLDDTIANTYSTIVKLAKKYDKEILGGAGIPNELVMSEDYYYFARMLGWTSENVTAFFQKYYPSYLERIVPNEEAATTLLKLKKINLSIYIITARRESTKHNVLHITEKWLKKNKIIYDNLTINVINKGDVVKSVNGKYFLDDSITNCITVKEKNPKAYVFLLNTKYNTDINYNGIKRVQNLEEFYEIVRRIENGEEYSY